MQQSYSLFGMFTLALRLVVGWTGSFLIGITLKDANGNIILDRNGEDLSKFPAEDI